MDSQDHIVEMENGEVETSLSSPSTKVDEKNSSKTFSDNRSNSYLFNARRPSICKVNHHQCNFHMITTDRLGAPLWVKSAYKRLISSWVGNRRQAILPQHNPSSPIVRKRRFYSFKLVTVQFGL